MNDRLLKALKGECEGRPPVWLMRQAGRYLPEYRALRKNHSLWEMFHHPELAAQVTRLPLAHIGVDAAILFSDILVIAEVFGLKLHFPEGAGPFVEPSIQCAADVDALVLLPVEEVLCYVQETIAFLKQDLPVNLIGFCGGPFTIASYLIEKGGKGDLAKTKQWLYSDPLSFHQLLSKITEVSIAYLKLQVRSGVDAIQIFDSWAGLLAAPEFVEFSLRYLKQMVDALKDLGVPLILFCRGSSLFANELASCSPSAISFDWKRELSDLRKIIPPHIAVQGNLDPHLLRAPPQVIRKAVKKLLHSMQGDPRFIVNLGHGVPPDIPVDHVKCFVDAVKESF